MSVDPRLVFATDVFIREMKRQWFKQHPSNDPADCPVKILEDYPPMQRLALVMAIGKASAAMTGMNDQFDLWVQMKTANVNPEQAQPT